MSTATRLLYQNLIQFDSGPLSVHIVSESNLIEEQDQLRMMLERNKGRALGLSGAYSPAGELAMLAIADTYTIIIIEFESKKSKGNGRDGRSVTPVAAADNTAARQILTDHLLRRSTGFLYGFKIASLALALFQTLGLRVANAIDMQCAGPLKTRRDPLTTIKRAIGDLHRVYDDNIKRIFSIDTIDPNAHVNGYTTPLALRAWIVHFLSQLAFLEDRLAQVPPVDTFRLSDDTMAFLASMTTDAKADRHQHKIRKGKYQRASISIGEGAGQRGFTAGGAIAKSQGRIAQIQFTTIVTTPHPPGKIICSIRIVGHDDPMQAEVQRAQKVLEILQGLINLERENPWVHLCKEAALCVARMLRVGKSLLGRLIGRLRAEIKDQQPHHYPATFLSTECMKV